MNERITEARVFDETSHEAAELASITENAYWTNRESTEWLLLLRRWQQLYQSHFPLLEGKRASGRSRWAKFNAARSADNEIDENSSKSAKSKVPRSDERGPGKRSCIGHGGHYSKSVAGAEPVFAATSQSTSTSEQDAPTFRQRVKLITGVSDSTLTRDLRIIDGLTDEQVYRLGTAECTKKDMAKIIDATPGDLAKRDAVVKLVEKQTKVEIAIADVMGASNRSCQ